MTTTTNHPAHTEGKWTISESPCTDQKMLNNDCDRNHIDIPEIEAEIWFTIDEEGMGRKAAEANAERIVKAVNMHDQLISTLLDIKKKIGKEQSGLEMEIIRLINNALKQAEQK